jgi:hypothetical protein
VTQPNGRARTLLSLNESSQFRVPKKHLSSKFVPNLQIEPNNIVIDELLLRIGDVLLSNVILQADSLDKSAGMQQ